MLLAVIRKINSHSFLSGISACPSGSRKALFLRHKHYASNLGYTVMPVHVQRSAIMASALSHIFSQFFKGALFKP